MAEEGRADTDQGAAGQLDRARVGRCERLGEARSQKCTQPDLQRQNKPKEASNHREPGVARASGPQGRDRFGINDRRTGMSKWAHLIHPGKRSRFGTITWCQSMHENNRNRESAAGQLRLHLSQVSTLRREALVDPSRTAVREALRRWQAQRLAVTYPDLLASPRFGQAARFFLDDLYGPKTFSRRDAEVARIVPALTRMLPGPALEVIARALELDALSETLDAEMTRLLGTAPIDAPRYASAYLRAGSRIQRERQIELIGEVGAGLNNLVRTPLLGASLGIMRGPAVIAGLVELHDFLQRGFDAFRKMGDATEFLQIIAARESALLHRLYAGEADPFEGLT
jgi:hypothetical protein